MNKSNNEFSLNTGNYHQDKNKKKNAEKILSL